jgi:NAD(P)-dependent dehydrogenase (short-subunit alcohol dehydrogenase family)
VLGTHLCCRAVLRGMIERERGRIVTLVTVNIETDRSTDPPRQRHPHLQHRG